MWSKLSLVAALALAPWSSALLLATPVGWQSSSIVNVSWSSVPSDPPFTFQLFNTDEFHDTFAVANNVNPTLNFDSFQLGVVPAGQYTLRAINVTNGAQIYDETPAFAIAAAPTTTSSSASSTVSSAASSGSVSASLTGSGSNTLTVPAASSTSGGFGTTVKPSGTSGTSGTNTDAGTSSSGSAAPTGFNNGAASLPSLAPWAIAALGVVAGGAALL